MIWKGGANYAIADYKPGSRYWISYSEKVAERSQEEEKILKEIFGK